MARDTIRLMHVFFLPGAGACDEALWHPNTDVYQLADGSWLVKFELAGVQAKDIELEVLGGRMTLRGVRRDEVTLRPTAPPQPAGVVQYRMEIAYSRFERNVDFPCELRKAGIDTEYRDGMLLVHVSPSTPADAGRGGAGRNEEGNP